MIREGARYFQEDPTHYGGLVNDTTPVEQYDKLASCCDFAHRCVVYSEQKTPKWNNENGMTFI